MAWTFVLKDAADNEIGEAAAASTQLRWERNRPAEVQLSTAATDPEPKLIRASLPGGLPRLDVHHDDELWFRGEWAPSRIDDGPENSTAAIVFRDPLDALTDISVDDATYTGVDQGEILWDLIAKANAVQPTGLRQGVIESTVARDRTYQNQRLLDLIQQMTAVIDGPDIYLTPVAEGAMMAAFNVTAEQGSLRDSAVFEHGPGTIGNVLTASSYQYRPVNRVVVLGENGMRGIAEDLTSQGLFGVRQQTVSASDGTTDQATLDAKAQGLIRPAPVEVVQFTPHPDLAPQPGLYASSGRYWVRDICTFRSSVLNIEAQVRPNSVAITVDQDGRDVAHLLTFDDQE